MGSLPIFLCITVPYLFMITQVSAENIKWAGDVSPTDRYFALGPPDLRAAVPLNYTIRNFGPTMVYRNLSELDTDTLNPAPNRLHNLDTRVGYLIGFEGNGLGAAGVSGGWESSIWTFSDSHGSFMFKWNETLTVADNNSNAGVNAVKASGPINADAY